MNNTHLGARVGWKGWYNAIDLGILKRKSATRDIERYDEERERRCRGLDSECCNMKKRSKCDDLDVSRSVHTPKSRSFYM